MLDEDVPIAADVLRRGDFGDRDDFLRWALGRRAVSLFVAEVAGRVVGTGVASAHGPVGWVGVIFVAPAYRGSGIGRQLTRTVIDQLEQDGCRSIVLIASPLGRPIYEREGFSVLDTQVRFTIDAIALEGDGDHDQPATSDAVRPFAPSDRDAVVALDRFATGEDRSVVLRDLVTPATTLVAVGPDDEIRGYLTRPPWRGGAVIAPDPADALHLLERRRRMPGVSGRVGAGLLATNERGRAILREAGWAEEVGNIRMLRGEPIDWHPDAIWAQMNGALG
jgi:GNAT superfamily N-acetyltransferase